MLGDEPVDGLGGQLGVGLGVRVVLLDRLGARDGLGRVDLVGDDRVDAVLGVLGLTGDLVVDLLDLEGEALLPLPLLIGAGGSLEELLLPRGERLGIGLVGALVALDQALGRGVGD